jgi:flagellar biosynthesis chaperone FliJ
MPKENFNFTNRATELIKSKEVESDKYAIGEYRGLIKGQSELEGLISKKKDEIERVATFLDKFKKEEKKAKDEDDKYLRREIHEKIEHYIKAQNYAKDTGASYDFARRSQAMDDEDIYIPYIMSGDELPFTFKEIPLFNGPFDGLFVDKVNDINKRLENIKGKRHGLESNIRDKHDSAILLSEDANKAKFMMRLAELHNDPKTKDEYNKIISDAAKDLNDLRNEKNSLLSVLESVWLELDTLRDSLSGEINKFIDNEIKADPIKKMVTEKEQLEKRLTEVKSKIKETESSVEEILKKDDDWRQEKEFIKTKLFEGRY